MKKIISLALVLLIAVTAFAQNSKKVESRANKDVEKYDPIVSFTPEQKEQYKAMRMEYYNATDAIFANSALSDEEKKAEKAKVSSEYSKKMYDILDADQTKALKAYRAAEKAKAEAAKANQ